MKEVKEYSCTECKEMFELKEEFETHMKLHSTSPPSKKLRNTEEASSDVDQMDTETITKDQKVEDEVILDVPDVILLEENKEIDICFEEISKLHDCKDEQGTQLRNEVLKNLKDDCREEQFKLRCEALRILKEEKNNEIEALKRVLDDVKLENATLNFIVSTIDNPVVVEQLIEENSRISKENKELKSILEVRDTKIKDLEQQPKLYHKWRIYEDKSENDEHDISQLERLADLKLKFHESKNKYNKKNYKKIISP